MSFSLLDTDEIPNFVVPHLDLHYWPMPSFGMGIATNIYYKYFGTYHIYTQHYDDVSNDTRDLNFHQNLHLHQKCVYASSEGSSVSATLLRLAWALATGHVDKYQDLMSWPEY